MWCLQLTGKYTYRENFNQFKISFSVINVDVAFYLSYVCRGPNVKFDDDEILNRINCYCHLLNNIIGHMCGIEPAKEIIDKVSSLVSYVRNSGLGVNCDPQLKPYLEARWNTVHDTLDSVSKNYVTLSKILLEKEEADKRSDVLGMLTSIPRMQLEVICEFLAKFKIWIKELESDTKPTLWMVWPIFNNLKKHLKDADSDDQIIRAMKVAGREYLEKNISDFEPKLVHKISTVLNPMLKNIAIASQAEKSEVYSKIDEELKKYTLDTMDRGEIEGAVIANQDILDDFMGQPDFSETQSRSGVGNYSDEFHRYLGDDIPISNPFKFDLLEWWFKNRQFYKNLFRLFISKVGICASSSASERSFSTTGIILEARRTCLIPETVQNLILARNKYLEFK